MTTPNASTLAAALQRLLDAQRALDLYEEPGPDYSADAHEAALTELSVAQHHAEKTLGDFYGVTASLDLTGIEVAEVEPQAIEAAPPVMRSACGGFVVMA